MTNILMTVGTNPLPVVVAARRLWLFHTDHDGQPPAVILLHSDQSKNAADCIQSFLRAREIACTSRRISDAMLPRRILADMNGVCGGFGNAEWHVHYTGGTKAMGIHTVEAVLSQRLGCESSYLNLRNHQIVGTGDRTYGLPDERRDAQLGLSLRDLVGLHGFTIDFRKRNGRTIESFGQVQPPHAASHSPNTGELPASDLLEIAAAIVRLAGATQASWDEFRKWLNACPWLTWPELPLTAPLTSEWKEIGSRVERLNIAVKLTLFSKRGFLEWAAAFQLSEALAARRLPFQVYCDVHVAVPPEPPNTDVTRDFQLDVLAILGYQAVLISCTTGGDIKEKGFEALHRIRQIGGEGTFVIVLCASDGNRAAEIEEELQQETGIPGDEGGESTLKQVRIWGRDCWSNLRGKFDDLLDELTWR